MSNTSKTKKTAGRSVVSMAAIDRYIDSGIVSPKETLTSSRNMVEWGDGNIYPDYLLALYDSVPTLRSIVNGNIDYITGDDITIAPLNEYLSDGAMNLRGENIREQVRNIAKDFEIYGGFALQVLRNALGEVNEVLYVDMRFLRMNKECDVFYYNEEWGKGGHHDVITYPAFMPNLDWEKLTDEERQRHVSSIVYVKNVHTQVYPAPIYAASVKACEIERNIDDFHINSLENDFTSSCVVNFNNGVPDDETKQEIEEDFNSKFSGHQNAGRVVLSWNPNKESATTIEAVKIEDFGARYDALSKHSRQQIFTAFRANPNLFGIPTENNGFNQEEYDSVFKLYNRTQIRPVQRMICDAYDRIYGVHGVLTITPFSLGDNNGDNEAKVN